MKEKKLIIQINKPAKEVFEFTLNPANTPLWIDSVVKEETNEWPVQKGTTYRNCGADGKWNIYTLTELNPSTSFTLSKDDQSYHVQYTLKQVDDNSTELEYYEWVEQGELEDPFTQVMLEKLKLVMEQN